MKIITLISLFLLFLFKTTFAQEDTLVSKQQSPNTAISQEFNNYSSAIIPIDTGNISKKYDIESVWKESYIYYMVDSVDFKRKSISQFGIGQSYLQNNYLTSLTYPGVNFKYSKTSEKQKGLSLSRKSFSEHFAYFSDVNTSKSFYEIGISYEYNFLFSVYKNPSSTFSFYIGPSGLSDIYVDIKTDNTNNPFAYRSTNSLGLSSMVAYRFKTKKFCKFSFLVDLPILALVAVPDYANVLPVDFYENFNLSAIYSVKAIGAYTRLRLITNFEFSFWKNSVKKSGSTWRLTHIYDGGNVSKPKEIGFSNHTVLIGKVYRIFNH